MDLGAFNDQNAGVNADAGWLAGANAGGYGDAFNAGSGYGYTFPILSGDAGSMSQQQFVPPVAQAQRMPWWEAVAAYGITRAIDNRFGPVQVAGNTQPGSFAGQNGKTYNNAPQATGKTTAPAAQPQSGVGLAVLAGLAALAFF